MSISCSNITYSRECFWTVPFIWLWSLLVLVEPLPAFLAAALSPNTRLQFIISVPHWSLPTKTKKPKPRKEKPSKDLLVWLQCFYKAKVAGGAAVPAGWAVLGAAGSWVRRGFLRQGSGQGIQQQIWDHFEKLWGCTKQDIVSAHFPWSSPRWQQFPVLSAGRMMLTFVQGDGESWAGLGAALAGPVWGRTWVPTWVWAGRAEGCVGFTLWASLQYQADLNVQE